MIDRTKLKRHGYWEDDINERVSDGKTPRDVLMGVVSLCREEEGDSFLQEWSDELLGWDENMRTRTPFKRGQKFDIEDAKLEFIHIICRPCVHVPGIWGPDAKPEDKRRYCVYTWLYLECQVVLSMLIHGYDYYSGKEKGITS